VIRVEPAPEPDRFDLECRRRGRAWLASAAGRSWRRMGKPSMPAYWTAFEPELYAAFEGRCGYAAMYIPPPAQVDHYQDKAASPDLAYEWDNYRVAAPYLNAKKSGRTVLDPFEITGDWFEVLWPSLQLAVTAAVPRAKRQLAENTIRDLGLRDSEWIIRWRQSLVDAFLDRQATLDELRLRAPLLAAMVERHRISPGRPRAAEDRAVRSSRERSRRGPARRAGGPRRSSARSGRRP